MKSKIPKTIWAIGFVSMFMDLSSELIHAVLPLFMVSALGASMVWVGFIEGISEAISMIIKIFSGAISDFIGKRKILTVIGYGLSTITKPLFPLADNINTVLFARFTDRIGKGIRGAPRDALVGDIAPEDIRGECFGLRQSLDTFGAMLAPLIAIILMIILSNDMRAVMWFATIPAVICIVILIFGVKEPEKNSKPNNNKYAIKFSSLKNFDKSFWIIVTAACFVTMARFSDAFLLLKANDIGMKSTYIPFVLVIMNLVYVASAYPLGILSDKISREKLFSLSIIILIIANIILAFSGSVLSIVIGTAVWGLHMGASQGLMATIITDKSPENLRGTAYGIYNFICGVGMFISSILGGFLWDNFGAIYTFIFGAILALLSLGVYKL